MAYLIKKGFIYTYRFFVRWRIWAIISLPIILLPIMIVTRYTPEAKVAYVMLLVAWYWIFGVVPLAITALLPAALFPLLGIMPSEVVSPIYMKDINMLLFVGIACAVGVEYSNLHRRIALKVLLTLGTKPRWLFLGFMLPTMMLSMWITNTSSTAMMAPIADSVLQEMYPFENPDDTEEEREQKKPDDPELIKEAYDMRNGILICICTAASIGGTGTMTGAGSNLVLMGIVETAYPAGEVELNYGLWMAFCIPNMIVCAFVMWIVLQLYFLGFKRTLNLKRQRVNKEMELKTKEIIRGKYKDLGPITFHEVMILIIFVLLVITWIFRAPGFMDGWIKLIKNTVKVKDSATAVIALTFMFLLPSTPDWWWSDVADRGLDEPPARCLNWEIIHARFTWSVPFIMGGGFAIAEGCRDSGLSKTIADWLLVLEGTSPTVLCLCVMLMSVLFTTVTSNTATSTILLPIMVELANAMKIAPLFLLFPCTLACSFSYLLPISSPPNAIVFERTRMTVMVMVKSGIWLAIANILVTLFITTYYGPVVLEMKKHPHAD